MLYPGHASPRPSGPTVHPNRRVPIDVRHHIAAACSFLLVTGILTAAAAADARAQDVNIHRPPGEIEARLATGDLRVTEREVIRAGSRSTDLVILDFGEWGQLAAKWRRAPDGGHEWNNAPRYELAAYELQKLFLGPADYVVPPTALRCMSPAHYAWLLDREDPPGVTFEGTRCVLVLLQYWLRNVTSSGVWDEDRMARDEGYARHLANLNVLTYLVEHKDSNTGNFLISTASTAPRVFSVDNAIILDAARSPRGTEWRWLRVERIPRETAERLRGATPEEFRARLETLVQFEPRDGEMRPAAPSENLDPTSGVRVAGDTVQLGLTGREIDAIYRRAMELLHRLDSGELEVF